jgi:hypothetical protein
MDVEGRSRASLQELARDELSVRGEQESIRFEVIEDRATLIRTEPFRRRQIELARPRRLRDRRRSWIQAASGRAVRSGDHEQLVGELWQATEQRNGERPGSQEGEAADGRH